MATNVLNDNGLGMSDNGCNRRLISVQTDVDVRMNEASLSFFVHASSANAV